MSDFGTVRENVSGRECVALRHNVQVNRCLKAAS